MSDRLPCAVPGCRRTRKRAGYIDFICRDHWRLTPAAWRRRYRKINRMVHRATNADRVRRLRRISDAMWFRLRAAAIEAAVGLR